jgi:hypothetical protein
VSPRYVPLLLSVDAWPGCLTALATRLGRILACWEDLLVRDLESHVLSIARGLRAHECLRRARLWTWFVAQLDAQVPGGPGAAIDPTPVSACGSASRTVRRSWSGARRTRRATGSRP